MIQFEHTHIGYDRALVKVQIEELAPEKAYALVGRNGSGKSTLLKTISGQISCQSGTIRIHGQSLAELSHQERAKLVAFVPSRVPEIQYLKAYDFIALGRTPYLNAFGRLHEQDKHAIQETIDLLGISQHAEKYLANLSDGEKQLCAIARALCQETPVIVLDEPTGFLDFRNRGMVIDLLNDLAVQSKKSILFSTHELHLLEEKKMPVIGITTDGWLAGAEEVNVESLLRRFF